MNYLQNSSHILFPTTKYRNLKVMALKKCLKLIKKNDIPYESFPSKTVKILSKLVGVPCDPKLSLSMKNWKITCVVDKLKRSKISGMMRGMPYIDNNALFQLTKLTGVSMPKLIYSTNHKSVNTSQHEY